MAETIYYAEAPSPLGELLLLSDGESLSGLYFAGHRRGPAPGADWRRDKGPFKQVEDELARYFAGESCEFNVRLAPRGSEFQREVWNELRRIPPGATLTYAQLAARIGRPKAVRAAGAANARNPISIIVPCHRVVGARGALTGYAGGLERKEWLLRHETRLNAPVRVQAASVAESVKIPCGGA
ncbi:MAG TPA: methylated-DNA--[protein]-cysteine S-methyltransferase [Pirellulales bacterium]|nr:methylated-DNA--[protein]-cysteine S-methyltransferase [Pirellulales bacterium]